MPSKGGREVQEHPLDRNFLSYFIHSSSTGPKSRSSPVQDELVADEQEEEPKEEWVKIVSSTCSECCSFAVIHEGHDSQGAVYLNYVPISPVHCPGF